MRFAFDDEQMAIQESARRFLSEHWSTQHVLSVMETDEGYDRALWRRVCDELGWASLSVPEAYGGCGMGAVGLVALLEEMGRALYCSPFFATMGLGAPAILAAGSEEQKERYLAEIASGEATATLAWKGAGRTWGSESVDLVARKSGNDFVVSGSCKQVLDGHTATVIIVATRVPSSTGRDGVSLFVVPGEAPGLRRQCCSTLDMTRKSAELVFDDVVLPASMLMGAYGEAGADLEHILNHARVALAAEQVGGAEACLSMAVDYAKVREQFGRAIGSFQAIKHKCADMFLLVESARSASYFAGWAASQVGGNLLEAALVAQAYCSDAFWQCAAENIQIHGGIGFTWEHAAHLYFKRARASAAWLGDGVYHRSRMAETMGLGASAP